MNELRSASDIFKQLATSEQKSNKEGRIATGAFLRGTEEVSLFRNVDGCFGIAVPATEEEFDRTKNDLSGLAIKLTTGRASDRPEIRLTLFEKSQLELFSVFVDDVVEFLSNDPPEPVAGVKRLFDRWRRLFANGSKSVGLDLNTEVGLICELEVLLELVNRGLPVESWTGPVRDRHDFKIPGMSIECKATTRANGLRITIHGTQQLETVADQDLVLVVRQYESMPEGPISLPSLVQRILDVPSVEQDLFLAKLSQSGVDLNAVLNASDEFRTFRAWEAYEFDVIDDFPRVQDIHVSSRIQDLVYTLDLSDPMHVPGVREVNEFFD